MTRTHQKVSALADARRKALDALLQCGWGRRVTLHLTTRRRSNDMHRARQNRSPRNGVNGRKRTFLYISPKLAGDIQPGK